jgi:tetratricopeptide (TPR) repeat protein
MAVRKVFIGSTGLDLAEYRKAAERVCIDLGFFPIAMEHFEAMGVGATAGSKIKLDDADLYVGIFAHRYGYIENGYQASVTEIEFDYAGERGLQRLCFEVEPKYSWPPEYWDHQNYGRLKNLKQRIGALIRAKYTTVDNFERHLIHALLPHRPSAGEESPHPNSEIARLLRILEEKEKAEAFYRGQIVTIQQENQELKRDMRALAVAQVLDEAEQTNPSPEALDAKRALEAGDTLPAEALLRREELTVAASGREQFRRAAELARQQTALAFLHDTNTALAAARRAADYEPDNLINWWFLGDLLRRAGDFEDANEAYRRISGRLTVLTTHDPMNTEWQRDLAISHERIGDILEAQGDSAAALSAYRKSLTIREALIARDSTNNRWQCDLAISHERIGNIVAAQGDSAAALSAYYQSLAIWEEVTRRDPANMEWQRDLSVIHNQIGDALAAQGDSAAALSAYRTTLEIRQKLAESDPGNTNWQRDLTGSHERIGDMLAAQGDSAGALSAYHTSLTIRKALTSLDPGNMDWQRDLLVSYGKMGDILMAQGDRPAALQAYRKGFEIAEQRAAHDVSNMNWRSDLAISHSRIGDILTGQGDNFEALAEYRKSLELAKQCAGRDPANMTWQRELSVSHEKLAMPWRLTAITPALCLLIVRAARSGKNSLHVTRPT